MPLISRTLTLSQAFPASQCLCAAYAKKHPVGPDSEPETLLIVDMGQLQTTVVVARFGEIDEEESEPAPAVGEAGGVESSASTEAEGKSKSKANKFRKGAIKCPFKVLNIKCDRDLGACSFDQQMFEHFVGKVRKFPGSFDSPAGQGLYRRCAVAPLPIRVTWCPALRALVCRDLWDFERQGVDMP